MGLGVLVACKRSRRWFDVASIAPVTDSIRSFVFLAGGCTGGCGIGGGCGLGGGGLDGGGFPFLDGGVAANGCTGGGGCGGLTTVAGCFSAAIVVVVVIVPNRSTLALSDVTKILVGWLVKTLVAGILVSMVAPNPASGAVLSMPKEANGLVDSTDIGGGSYVWSLLKFRKGFSPAPAASAKSWRKGLETCGGKPPPGSVP